MENEDNKIRCMHVRVNVYILNSLIAHRACLSYDTGSINHHTGYHSQLTAYCLHKFIH